MLLEVSAVEPKRQLLTEFNKRGVPYILPLLRILVYTQPIPP